MESKYSIIIDGPQKLCEAVSEKLNSYPDNVHFTICDCLKLYEPIPVNLFIELLERFDPVVKEKGENLSQEEIVSELQRITCNLAKEKLQITTITEDDFWNNYCDIVLKEMKLKLDRIYATYKKDPEMREFGWFEQDVIMKFKKAMNDFMKVTQATNGADSEQSETNPNQASQTESVISEEEINSMYDEMKESNL